VLDQLGSNDHPITMTHEVEEHVERLALNADRRPPMAKLEEAVVELEVVEDVDHGDGPLPMSDP
jgi:hypothetical protein